MIKSVYDSSPDKAKKAMNALPSKERFLRNWPGVFYSGKPAMFANAMFACEGDMAAAALLIYLQWRWKGKARFHRLNKEWIVMSAEEWAFASGLTLSQLHKRALPRLRNKQFVEIRQGKLSYADKQKKLLMRLIPEDLPVTHGEDWCRYVSKHFYKEEWFGFS